MKVSTTIIIMLFLTSCVGYDTAVFYTKTNYGVDLSAAPPTTALDISRSEGVITPQFEDGQTPPVLASFRSSGANLFSHNVGSAFATGTAAKTMATLYNSPVVGTPVNGSFKLGAIPKIPAGVFTPERDYKSSSVKPVLFGTRTSFGISAAWSNLTAMIPDTFTFGYNRKELAVAPVTIKENSTTDVDVSIASLLATLTAFSELEGPHKDEHHYLQYFATGEAADNLASQPEIRVAMIRKLDPSTPFNISKVGISLPVIFTSYRVLKMLALNSDPIASNLLTKIDAKTYTIPDTVRAAGVEPYTSSTSTSVTIDPMTDPAPAAGAVHNKFNQLVSFIKKLESKTNHIQISLSVLKTAKANGTSVSFTGFTQAGSRTPTDADISLVEGHLKIATIQFEKYRKVITSDQEIYAGYTYVAGQLVNNGG